MSPTTRIRQASQQRARAYYVYRWLHHRAIMACIGENRRFSFLPTAE